MLNYVLVTAARNEGRFIERTLRSVVAQTRLPLHWVIVDDGSTDDILQLVEEFAEGTSLDRARPPVTTVGP